jgi:hypothetical protein
VIRIPEELDLGRDQTRMKDRRDAERQALTVQTLLDRMYPSDPAESSHLQIVADEVGMGKTFVALGVAYSVLPALRAATPSSDLDGVTPRVLVIAPQNAALVSKWRREVSEFIRRCVQRDHVDEANELFPVSFAERVDDLVGLLRAPGSGVVVTHTGVLSGGKKLQSYDLKRRVLLGALFRFWGNRFPYDDRARLLKGAPDAWPSRADELSDVTEEEADALPFRREARWVELLRRIAAGDAAVAGEAEGKTSDLDSLLELCRTIAKPYARDRDESFRTLEGRLNRLYRRVCFAGLQNALPLVIVDEAHNWKNGPTAKSNGYDGFERHIAPLCRRLLLLTATPFQLRPEEMLELVRAGEIIAPSPVPEENARRNKRLEELRTNVIRPVLRNSAGRSRSFSRAWASLASSAAKRLATVWGDEATVAVRAELKVLAESDGVVSEPAVERVITRAVLAVEPDLREIIREALWLYTFNTDLSQELSNIVVRHRRATDHRLIGVGSEFEQPGRAVARTDRHQLHAAPGIDVRGDSELPHYLLMRAVSELKQGRGRTSLGSALTGCYSTLLESDEGRRLLNKLPPSSLGAKYFGLLKDMVGADKDPTHPKVLALTEQVLATWRRGEKALIFCFRIPTARRIAQILGERMVAEQNARLAALNVSEEVLTSVRSRLTQRDEALINLVLDRVLWSLCWASQSSDLPLPTLAREDLRLRDDELDDLARLALRAGVDMRQAQVDRVFLHRCTEHLLAKRLLGATKGAGPLFRQICRAMVDEAWVAHPYGVGSTDDVLEATSATAEESDTHAPALPKQPSERGIHQHYVLSGSPSAQDVASLAAALRERRRNATEGSILDGYAEGASLWLGVDPASCLDKADRLAGALRTIHSSLLRITRQNANLAWQERLLVMEAVRRVVLSRSLFIRLLPGNLDREERGWASSLVERFFALDDGQHETLAERVSVFLEDFQGTSGLTLEEESPRNALFEATRARHRTPAVLVHGETDPTTRNRAFVGFNSPGLPDVLVCTSVGAEGIDLHRHCRNVVHYDLAWNPAVLEQRTGRVDRIGSKAFRDRLNSEGKDTGPFLDVGVPFLAGTYDERMFEELRIRAQTFEVLTGGDVSADNLEGTDESEQSEGQEAGVALPMLPAAMVDDLRVKLHVWQDGNRPRTNEASTSISGPGAAVG